MKLVKASSYWEMVLEVGNDWGEPSYTETETYETREELDKALEFLDYYSIPLKIKEVVEYKIDNEHENDESL